jgi:hypothetical protein
VLLPRQHHDPTVRQRGVYGLDTRLEKRWAVGRTIARRPKFVSLWWLSAGAAAHTLPRELRTAEQYRLAPARLEAVGTPTLPHPDHFAHKGRDNAFAVAGVEQGLKLVDYPFGARFVDGGIIGGPPRAGYDGPAFYVSGADANLVEALAPFGLKIVALDGPIGAASALKMSYAGITKGMIAISCSMILAAQRAGVSNALYNELSASQAALLAGLARGAPDMFSKAYRWVAEMREISGFAGPDAAEQEIFSGAANFYARIARDFDGANKEIAVLRDFFPSGPKRS